MRLLTNALSILLIVVMITMLQSSAFAQDADMDGIPDAYDPFPHIADGDGDGVLDGTDIFPSIRNMPIFILFSIAFFILYLIIVRFNVAGYRPRQSQRLQYRNNNIQDTIGLDIESALNIGVQQLRAENQGGAIHVHGHGTGRQRNIPGTRKNNSIKIGDIRTEALCHACKNHDHVKFICPNCGKYYCEQCATDIDEACLVCSNLLSSIK